MIWVEVVVLEEEAAEVHLAEREAAEVDLVALDQAEDPLVSVVTHLADQEASLEEVHLAGPVVHLGAATIEEYLEAEDFPVVLK